MRRAGASVNGEGAGAGSALPGRLDSAAKCPDLGCVVPQASRSAAVAVGGVGGNCVI